MTAPLVDLDLPAEPASATMARRVVTDALQDIAVDRDAVVGMVSEAVANCAAHAYPGSTGRVRVWAQLEDGGLDVVVSDDGIGVTDSDESSGFGLGVALMGDLADGVQVEADSGTRVSARFELFGAAGPHGRLVAREGRTRLRLSGLLRRPR